LKLIRTTRKSLLFQFGRRERALLLTVLQLYPRIPPAHQRLSQSARVPDPEGAQHLLDEALAEQRAENRKQLQALLTDPKRFTEKKTGLWLRLSFADAEWLLQVLNDIRVGSWIFLGSPAEGSRVLTEQTAPHFWVMEMAGYFQSTLLEALENRGA
jgi:hypothetical protein